jgi:hypothetical protein
MTKPKQTTKNNRGLCALLGLLLMASLAACTTSEQKPAAVGGDHDLVAEHEHPMPVDQADRNPHFTGPQSALPDAEPDKGEQATPDLKSAPPWVLDTCQSFFEAKQPVLCAKAKMVGSKDSALGRATAAARARVALDRRLGKRISALRVHFLKTVHVHEPPPTTDQIIERLGLTMEQDAVWVSPSGALYILVSIKQSDFVQRLEIANIHDVEFARFLGDYLSYLFSPGTTAAPLSP